MPECALCAEHDHPKLLEYAPLAAVYCHRACLLAAAARNPWAEPIFSLLYETRLYRRVPGHPAICCRRGHALTDENVLVHQDGGRLYRKCKTCDVERRIRGRPAKRELDRCRREREREKERNWERTHCRQGHAYTEESIVMGRYGEKKCRECLRLGGAKGLKSRWSPRAGQETRGSVNDRV